jgi:hypothetical protein
LQRNQTQENNQVQDAWCCCSMAVEDCSCLEVTAQVVAVARAGLVIAAS